LIVELRQTGERLRFPLHATPPCGDPQRPSDLGFGPYRLVS
jgi:hypothetical protein